jgi:hypothetical protein
MLVQCANADECSARDFLTLGKYSHVAATMSFETFKEWWTKLIAALSTQTPPPVYNPDDLGGETMCKNLRATAVEKVLGVSYGGKTDCSWFFQKAVQF